MDNYFSKYLKYKKKYINLKNGGSSKSSESKEFDIHKSIEHDKEFKSSETIKRELVENINEYKMVLIDKLDSYSEFGTEITNGMSRENVQKVDDIIFDFVLKKTSSDNLENSKFMMENILDKLNQHPVDASNVNPNILLIGFTPREVIAVRYLSDGLIQKILHNRINGNFDFFNWTYNNKDIFNASDYDSYGDNFYDMVVIDYGLHADHGLAPIVPFNQINRILKQGGKMIVPKGGFNYNNIPGNFGRIMSSYGDPIKRNNLATHGKKNWVVYEKN